MNQTLRNILVVRTDRLGDVILTLPVCSTLRQALPAARVSVLVRHYVGPVVSGNPFVDDIIWEDDKQGTPRKFWGLRDELKEKEFDAAIIVRPTFRNATLMFAARIPVRVGTGYRWYSGLFTHRVRDHRKTAHHHELEYNLRLLAPLGITPPLAPTPTYGIVVPPEARREMSEILRSLGVGEDSHVVVLHPSSGGSAREWPPDRFREVGLRLMSLGHCRIVVTGMPTEERILRRVLDGSGSSFVSLVGRLSLGLLAALLERAKLFISNSTGPLHLAAALGTSVIGLYPPIRPMSAARWGPYGGNAIALTGTGPDDCTRCTGGGHCTCMLSIPISQVMDAASELLNRSSLQKGMSVA